jgi:hypothetical protein
MDFCRTLEGGQWFGITRTCFRGQEGHPGI